LLRENDGLEYQDEIMDILLKEGVETAHERFQQLESITDKLGGLVNSKFSKKINKIYSNNTKGNRGHGSKKSNAPASHNL